MPRKIDGERRLTALDFARLKKLTAFGVQPDLIDLLCDADIVDSRQVPPDVVTMYSQVLLEDLATRSRRELVLCYPADAEPNGGFISVLSPVGLALLGLPVGATARWCAPSGEESSAVVMAILFQPEASGDYVT